MTFAPVETADYVICSGTVPRGYRNAGGLPAAARHDACARAVHGLRQSRRRGRARRDLALLRRRDRRPLRQDRRRRAVCRQALCADLRSGAASSRRTCAASKVDKKRVLAIGDSVRTDFTGAASYGIDCLFVTAGIHSAEFGGRDDPDPDAVERVSDRRRRQAARDCAQAGVVNFDDWKQTRFDRGIKSQLRSTLCAAASSAAAMFSAAAWSSGPLRSRSRSASFRFSMPRTIGSWHAFVTAVLAGRADAREQRVERRAVGGEKGLSFGRDAVALAPAVFGFDRGIAHVLEPGEGRIDHAGTGAVAAAHAFLDGAHQFVAVTRLLDDHVENDEAKLAVVEQPAAPADRRRWSSAMSVVTGVDVPVVALMRAVRVVMAVSAASVSVSHQCDISLDISEVKIYRDCIGYDRLSERLPWGDRSLYSIGANRVGCLSFVTSTGFVSCPASA